MPNYGYAYENEKPESEPVDSFNPVDVLEITIEDDDYHEFLSAYWSHGNDELKGIHHSGVSYSQLQAWKKLPEVKEHMSILRDYRVSTIESQLFVSASKGESRSMEFILGNLSEMYKKKKPSTSDGNVDSLDDLVTKVVENGNT